MEAFNFYCPSYFSYPLRPLFCIRTNNTKLKRNSNLSSNGQDNLINILVMVLDIKFHKTYDTGIFITSLGDVKS